MAGTRRRFFAAALALIFTFTGLLRVPAAGADGVILSESKTVSYEVPGGKLYFEPETGTITWAQGEDMEELTIPDEINGTEVKIIKRWGLSGLKKLKKLNLPKGRNILGEGSLAELTAIEEFTVPDTCDAIPRQCFYGCTSLKKISLPSTITYIGEMAFYNCSALEYVDIPGNCLKIDRMAFYSCTGLKGVAFVKDAECNATAWGIFYNCTSLEKVVNIPGIRFKMFYDSGKRAEKWLDNSVSINEQKEMWRLKYGTEEEQDNKIYWIEGDELKKREDAIRDLAKEITKDCSTDREKIAAVMNWVDDKLEYERGHDNHPWAVYNGIKAVEAGEKEEQLNSCGGYSNMTQVLLQALSIPCATFWRKNLNGESMDHEFCAAYFEGKWRWLDTTHSDDRKEGLELGLGTPSFFYDSDHRVDYLLYRSKKGESIYKELPLDIEIADDEKSWPDQNPSDAYIPGKAAADPDWEHEEDPADREAEKEKIKAREEEFPKDIPVSDEALFVFDKDTGTITGVKDKNAERINIPETIDGVAVTAIGDEAFMGLYKLEYLTMPDTIVEIGKYAFARNYNLKRIHLSAGVTELKEGILQTCTSLDSVTIPKNVKRLDKDLFSNCRSLEEALFEDYDFKIKVIETDPLGSDNYYATGQADISWYCFAGNVGRALHGLDFHETYIGTKYYRNLQALKLTDDWRKNIVDVHQSQMGYREGFSPYHLDGSNSREFRLSEKAVDYEWGHFAEASRFTGYQPATWCRAFIDWAYAMAGVRGYESTEYQWKDTVYAGGTVELEPGDMLGMGKSHWCMVGSVKELDDGTVEMWIIHGNHSDRKVMDEVRHYNKETGKATDMEDDDYDYFRAIYKIDFSGVEKQTVTFDPGEGSCEVKNRVYCKGAYYGCLPDAVLEDHVFKGWYTEPGGKGLKAYPYRNLGEDINTLYAYYEYDPNAVKGISLDMEEMEIGVGERKTITAAVTPSGAENKNVTWRTGNYEVATVENGIVTGVKEGTVEILARTEGGPYVAYCTVKVVKGGNSSEEGSENGSGEVSGNGSENGGGEVSGNGSGNSSGENSGNGGSENSGNGSGNSSGENSGNGGSENSGNGGNSGKEGGSGGKGSTVSGDDVSGNGVSGNGTGGKGGSVSTDKPAIPRVPLSAEDGFVFASADDNFAPNIQSGKIKNLTLDFSKVKGSAVSPDQLKMTVIKGSKFTTAQKLSGDGSPEKSGKIKVKVNKDGTAAITCNGDGSVSLILEDGNKYTIEFKVEQPKARKEAKKESIDPGAEFTRDIQYLFGTTIDAGELKLLKPSFAASVSDNRLLVVSHPSEKENVKVQYKYLDKKYKITIKIK